MTTRLSLHLTDWLSLIRHQVLQAVEISRQPPPISALAINGLQDAIEAFLRLSVEHLGAAVSGNRPDFIHVFDAVDNHPAVNGALAGHRTRLLALNTARVDFKHHGNPPSTATLERSRVNALAFFEEASTVALGMRFEDVSLTAFIRDEDARRLAEQASSQWSSGQHEAALGSLAEAFQRIIRDYERRKVGYNQRSLFVTRPSFINDQNIKWLGVDKLMDWIDAIDQRSKLLAFGVDLRRYTFFRAHTPAVMALPAGEYRVSQRGSHGSPVLVDDEAFGRCYRFVIDTAVTLGAEDFDFDARAARHSSDIS